MLDAIVFLNIHLTPHNYEVIVEQALSKGSAE